MGERVLIVGAGAVGQVYGRHLRAGGASVAFLVRPRYAAEARQGFAMAYLNRGTAIEREEGFEILDDLAQVAGQRWDQLWLCISSPALRGDWLAPTLAAAGGARVISFQPGLRDGELLGTLVPPERLVKGLISFSAWSSPMPGEPEGPKHLAYWMPPLSANLFEGPGAVEIAACLRAGGLPARRGPASEATARGSAVLLPAVAALECADWSFAGLRRSPWAELAGRGASEAMAIGAAFHGVSPGLAGALVGPGLLRMASVVAPWVAPFDIERFFKAHFSKVGEQTLLALGAWIAEGKARGLPVTALSELEQALMQSRHATATEAME